MSITQSRLGVKDNPGISYPLSPWLAYPFAGYITGVAAMHYRNIIENHRLKVIFGLFIVGLFPVIAALFLAQRGASFFRWGAVGVGFYIASFAIILIRIASSLAIGSYSQLYFQEALSLRGIASLAVVPIHYFIIYLVMAIGEKGVDLFRYILIALGVIVTSFLLARIVEIISSKVRQANKPKAVWFGLVGLFVLAAITTLISRKGATFLAILPRIFGQVVPSTLIIWSSLTFIAKILVSSPFRFLNFC